MGLGAANTSIGYTDGMSRVFATEEEERFHKLLAILAARCRTELDEIEIEIYDKALAPHGYEAVNRALESILVDRTAVDPFPPVGAILVRLNAATTPKALAMDVTNKICNAIRRKGRYWSYSTPDMERALVEELGQAGADIVKQLGGWSAIIEHSDTNPKHYHLWIRETAQAVLEATGSKYTAIATPDRKQIESK